MWIIHCGYNAIRIMWSINIWYAPVTGMMFLMGPQDLVV